MEKKLFILLISVFLISCGESIKRKNYQSPDEIYGELFEKVQSGNVFSDSKTFVDCVPKPNADFVLARYEEQKKQPNVDIRKFILENFSLPNGTSISSKNISNQSVEQYLQESWSMLLRRPEDDKNSLIPLRRSFAIQNSTGRELNYSDSYFTMLGLLATKKDTILTNMVLNFAQLIQDFGHIPQANRSYYLSRSNPPYFSLMVRLLAEARQEKQILVQYLPQMQREYQYFMAADGSEQLEKQLESLKKGQKTYRKVVFIEKDNILNRFFDDKDTPRPEAYREDISLLKTSAQKPNEFYRNIRSADESSFGNSKRWLKDEVNPASTQTTEILPVDLNAMLFHLEMILSEAYQLKGDKQYAESMKNLANKRKRIFDKYFWNDSVGYYFDYNFIEKKQKSRFSYAGVFPLVFNMASAAQASKVSEIIHSKINDKDFFEDDFRLQYMAIVGLRNYGKTEFANQIKEKLIRDFENELKTNPKTQTEISGVKNGIILKLLSEK